MDLNWGTIAASSVSAVAVWVVTNAVLSPWVDRRKRLVADKLKHDQERFPCGQCGYMATVPRWFMGRWVMPTDPNSRAPGYEVCKFCEGSEPRLPEPWEDEKAYRANVKREAKAAKKALKGKQP